MEEHVLSTYKALGSVPTHPIPLPSKTKTRLNFTLELFLFLQGGVWWTGPGLHVLEKKAGRMNLVYFVCFTYVTERYELYTILCND